MIQVGILLLGLGVWLCWLGFGWLEQGRIGLGLLGLGGMVVAVVVGMHMALVGIVVVGLDDLVLLGKEVDLSRSYGQHAEQNRWPVLLRRTVLWFLVGLLDYHLCRNGLRLRRQGDRAGWALIGLGSGLFIVAGSLWYLTAYRWSLGWWL